MSAVVPSRISFANNVVVSSEYYLGISQLCQLFIPSALLHLSKEYYLKTQMAQKEPALSN